MQDTETRAAPAIIDLTGLTDSGEQVSAYERRAHLRASAARCAVLDRYLYLVDALGPVGRTDQVDLMVANEVDDDLVLLAVGWRGCYLVRPAAAERAVLPSRAQVTSSWAFGALEELAVLRERGQRHLRIAARDEVVDAPLSRRAAEAAAQVCYVANQRISERASSPPTGHDARRLLADLTALAQRHRAGLVDAARYEREKRRLLSG